MRSQSKLIVLATLLAIVLLPALSGCGATPTPTTAPTSAPTKASTTAPTLAPTSVPPTKAPATATAAPATQAGQPTVGGTLIAVMFQEPDTLDPQKSSLAAAGEVTTLIGASLITRDPDTGKFVPYLAESWTASEDGLSLTFKLRKDVKFHDGTPLTAADYAWTIQRSVDPATKSAVGQSVLGEILKSVEAVDNLTLKLTLKEVSAPLPLALSEIAYWQPLPRAAVEKLGDQFGRQPVGVGPYKFKEWQTGVKIVLERNPDFKWAPAFIKGGPYIDTIEYRLIAEYSTILAGLEAGEIDFASSLAGLQSKDIPKLQALNKYQIGQAPTAGSIPCLIINASKAPLNDVRVRKALNYAVDRQGLIKAVPLYGVEQRGPVSPAVLGYWPGVEQIGFSYDAAKAKALLKEAGYTAGSDGMLQKDGQPLKLQLKSSTNEKWVKVDEVLKEQFKAVGIAIDIKTQDVATHNQDMMTGNMDLGIMGILYPDFDIVPIEWGSAAIGGADLAKVNDARFDELLKATRTTLDPDKRQVAIEAATRYMIDNALAGFLYSAYTYQAMSNRVKGAIMSPVTLTNWLISAYIVK